MVRLNIGSDRLSSVNQDHTVSIIDIVGPEYSLLLLAIT